MQYENIAFESKISATGMKVRHKGLDEVPTHTHTHTHHNYCTCAIKCSPLSELAALARLLLGIMGSISQSRDMTISACIVRTTLHC